MTIGAVASRRHVPTRKIPTGHHVPYSPRPSGRKICRPPRCGGPVPRANVPRRRSLAFPLSRAAVTSDCRSWSGGDGGQVGVPRPQQRLELQVRFFQRVVHQHLHHTTGQRAQHGLRRAVCLGHPDGHKKASLIHLMPDPRRGAYLVEVAVCRAVLDLGPCVGQPRLQVPRALRRTAQAPWPYVCMSYDSPGRSGGSCTEV